MSKPSKSDHFLKLKEYTWHEIREQVLAVNPVLTSIIDQLDPGNEYTLFKATYPYGTHLSKRGNFCLPTEKGKSIQLDDPQISDDIREKLGYNSPMHPAMLSLKNSFELYFPLKERIIPCFFVDPGKLFGLWKVLDTNQSTQKSYNPCGMWNITAGARSIFMLPKITEKTGHSKLQRIFNFSIDKPKDFNDHWHIFRAIYNNPNFGQQWEAEALFFSASWFKKLNDLAWRDFKVYLLDFAWKNSDFLRSQYILDLVFSDIQSLNNIKLNSYHADLVKHLFVITSGEFPGFEPAIDDAFAPIKRLQEIYLDIYGLKPWSPIIMQPAFFSLYTPCNPVYYSLQVQTAIGLSAKSSERASLIFDTHMIASLLNKYVNNLQTTNLPIENTPLPDLANIVKYNFFHSEPEDYPNIRSSQEIYKEDHTITTLDNSSLEFPKNSPFFNGCVRISHA